MLHAVSPSQGLHRSSAARQAVRRDTSPLQTTPSADPATLWAEHGFALSAKWAVGLAVGAVPVFTLIGLLLQ